MQTVLFHETVFGPIHSRRLGISLGINLMPNDGKICSFDCVYCEAGYNAQGQGTTGVPTRNDVHNRLNAKLSAMHAAGEKLDVITFSGNGEPTLHPNFKEIVHDVLLLRNKYYPEAKVTVLSNATMATRPAVHNALMLVDNNIQKLDTVCPDYIARVDRPTGRYDVEQVIAALEAFKGHVIVQTLFMQGAWQGHSVDNTTEAYVAPWLEALRRIQPQGVMVYTIDRATPATGLLKASPGELDAIAEKVRQAGIEVEVAY